MTTFDRRNLTGTFDHFGNSHLTELKVKQLQEELAVREATRSGRKRALQLRRRRRTRSSNQNSVFTYSVVHSCKE